MTGRPALNPAAEGVLADLGRSEWHGWCFLSHLEADRSREEIDAAVMELVRAGLVLISPDHEEVVVVLVEAWT